ncbi:MAG: TlpA family protein disulfide reductase [Planctomycetales bacterium]|nr:TlpA family protein disulfide reductase [Planctomycetales bacterium]
MKSSWLILLLFSVLFTWSLTARADSDEGGVATAEKAADKPKDEPAEMTIGSLAPPIDIEHWLSTAGGTVEPFHKLEPGKVYVIEFWATWCMPCVASMPHIAQLQQEYADKGVTIVSVSDEPLETVEGFLEREVMNMGEQAEDEAADAEEEVAKPTYAELTDAYCLTTDPDGSVKDAYFSAAGQNGIPCAFIVGKTGQVEWIGHPMAMDDVLAKVVDDTWDREAFGEEFRASQQLNRMMMTAAMAARQKDYDKVYAVAEELRNLKGSPEVQAQGEAAAARIEGLVLVMMIQNDQDEALKQLPAKFPQLDPEMANQIAWTVVQMHDGGVPMTAELLQLVAKLTEDLVDADSPDANVLDTVAHLQHAAGDLEAAIATQQRAVDSLADGPSDDAIVAYLAELKEEQAAPPADDADADEAATK